MPSALLQDLAIFGTGIAAGMINVVVGSGTLITFPTLLAFNFSPVLANVTNNVGLIPGSLTGAYGYRAELSGQRGRVLQLGSASLAGGIVGAILLLVLPAGAFKAIVPVLIGIALVMVVIQPRLAKWVAQRQRSNVRRRRDPVPVPGGAVPVPGSWPEATGPEATGPEAPRPGDTGPEATRPGDTGPEATGLRDTGPGATGPGETASLEAEGTGGLAARTAKGGPVVWFLVFCTGVYGGYFGAAQGVLLIALLGVALNDTLQRINGIKNILAALVNGVAAIVFIAVSHVDWSVAAIIALGSVIGGLIGAKVGRKLPPWGLRIVIICVGVAALIKLLV